MTHPPITYLFWATIGAGFMFMFAIQPQAQQSCDPVELVRFVGPQPEIHMVSETTYGRSTADWLQQFDTEQTIGEDDGPGRIKRWRRRHGR